MEYNASASTTLARPRRLLTLNETAELLVISRTGLYRLINAGELSPVRVGQRLRFRPEHLEDFLQRRSVLP
jgi:excisionase family DNA binding protein